MGGFNDNPKNILGDNTSNNQFDSSNVVPNADGSILERLQYLQALVEVLSSGNVIFQGAADAGTNSTTVIPIAALAGYGNDFFNNQFYLQILCNKNSAGAAPEKETRKITDYVSATGTFTCDAFSSAVEATDLCIILHESQVVLGSNNADNVCDSSSVVANADGSILERLEDLKDKVTAVDDYVDTEITALQTAIDNFAAAGGDGKAVVRKTVTFANTAADVNLFTITAGVNFKLYAFCTTNVESAAGCNIGVDLGSTAVIADTDCTILEANDIWHDASPDASVELKSVHEEYTAYGGTIVLDVETAKQVDSGVITFVCVYSPLSSNGAIAAA